MTGKKTKETCPVETVLSLIGNKWKILIVRDLLEGEKRFGALRISTGASQKVLTSNLREMEDAGLLTRTVFAQIPPKVEYALTDVGYSLAPIIDAMIYWGTDYKKYMKMLNK